MSENSPSPSHSSGHSSGLSTGKAILLGSIIIACGLFAAALVLPQRTAPVKEAANQAAPAQTPSVQSPQVQTPVAQAPAAPKKLVQNNMPAPSTATATDDTRNVPGRYQILKSENGASWRLDTVTGEITVCRLESDRLICAKSTEATQLPQVSAEQLEKQRAEQRKERRADKTAMIDKFFSFFERMLKFAEKNADKIEPTPDPYARPL